MQTLSVGVAGVESVADDTAHGSSGRPSVRFLFVGREWKRKGLCQAMDVVKPSRETNPRALLDVYGVDSSNVRKNCLKRLGSD